MPAGSGKRNDFAELFRPEVGETRDQLIGKMEAMLAEVRKWSKKGYEHAPENCPKAVEVAGEKKGGWISPKTWTCSLCGFWAGSIRTDLAQLEVMLDKLRALPESYRYGLGKGT